MTAPDAGLFVSNTPSLCFSNSSNESDLVLLSSNLRERPVDDGTFFQEWYGEVKNVSANLYCGVNIRLDLASAAGSLVFTAYASGQPYQAAERAPGPTISCLPPGKTAGMYASNIGETSAHIPEASGVWYVLGGVVGGSASLPTYVPDPNAPTITDAFDVVGGVSGTMVAGATISSVEFTTFIKDSSGLIQDRLTATHLASLAAGGSWTFATGFSRAGDIVDHLDSVTFVDGQ